MEFKYKGHTIRGRAEKVPGTNAWLPEAVVDKRVHAFAPLNFPRKMFDDEQHAIDYAVAYGIWIIDHPIPMGSDLKNDEEKFEESDFERDV